MILHHFKLILLLRWQLTRNQLKKDSGHGAVIAGIITILALGIAAGSFAGGLAVGAFVLNDASPQTILWMWLGFTVVFLFVWLIGLVTHLQRSESIDLQQLMHLPIPLGRIFVFNFVASHLTLSLIISVPAMIGLTGGMALSRGAMMLLQLPLALGMIFMVSAWTYCLRGWFATTMTHPRKRRSFIVMLALFCMLLIPLTEFHFRNHSPLGNMPSLAARVEAFQELPLAGKFIPPLWLPIGARSLAKHDPWPAVMGTFGVVLIGGLGLMRAYRSTLKFQRGETGGRASTRGRVCAEQGITSTAPQTHAGFLELRIPILPEESCAVALAEFRSMLRAPEIKIMFGMLVLILMIFVESRSAMGSTKMLEAMQLFRIPSALIFMAILLIPLVGNQFGFDRDGFRCLVLSPVERRWILFGKNLAFAPFLISINLFCVTVMSLGFRLPVLTALAGLFQSVSMVAILFICGNLFSILFPFRVSSGAVKPTKRPMKMMLAQFFCLFAVQFAMAPLVLPALVEFLLRSCTTAPLPINFLLSAVLAALMSYIYWLTLQPLGSLLEQREIRILSEVTTEVE